MSKQSPNKGGNQSGADRPYVPPKPQHVGTVPQDHKKYDENFGHKKG